MIIQRYPNWRRVSDIFLISFDQFEIESFHLLSIIVFLFAKKMFEEFPSFINLFEAYFFISVLSFV